MRIECSLCVLYIRLLANLETKVAVTVLATSISAVEESLALSDAQLRSSALAEWRSRFDPEGLLDPAALGEAARLAPIVTAAGAAAFDSASFGELVAFIAEMPF